jgi:hypothetical protein
MRISSPINAATVDNSLGVSAARSSKQMGNKNPQLELIWIATKFRMINAVNYFTIHNSYFTIYN